MYPDISKMLTNSVEEQPYVSTSVSTYVCFSRGKNKVQDFLGSLNKR